MNLREDMCGGDNMNGVGARKKKNWEVIVVVWKKMARKESGYFY